MNDFLDMMDKVVLPLAAVVATLVGLWLGHNVRRQMTFKLADTRREAYARLWTLTGLGAPTRLDGGGRNGYLDPEERTALWNAMTDWYYDRGGGMLLGEVTKTVYLNAKHNLVCRDAELRPAGLSPIILRELGRPPGADIGDEYRGILSIRQLSLLRTQLKSDLSIYGQTYAGQLGEQELFFLNESGVKLWSRAWASGAGYHHPVKQWSARFRAITDRWRAGASEPKSRVRPLKQRSGVRGAPAWHDPSRLSDMPIGAAPPPSSKAAVTRSSPASPPSRTDDAPPDEQPPRRAKGFEGQSRSNS